jgi:hypothetical protein
MDTIKKLNAKVDMGFLIKFIIIGFLVYLVTGYLVAYLSFDSQIRWWNKNGGKDFSNAFDIYSVALFQQSKLLFDIRQLFTTGQNHLNYTDIMLIQSIVLNQAKIITGPGGVPTEGNFTTPASLCRGIAWEDPVMMQYLYMYWMDAYNSSKGYDPENTNINVKVSLATGWDWPSKYQVGKSWADITGNSNCRGFWPHDNGCTEFFDIPSGNYGAFTGIFDNPYNLTNYTARSSIGEINNMTSGTLPKQIIINGNGTTGTNLANIHSNPVDPNSVMLYYIPGSPTPRGSWAQLFADFGVMYTTIITAKTSSESAVTSRVPQLSTGGADNQGKSDLSVWYQNSRFLKSGFYGPNFFSAYYIQPECYALLSWVSNLYDDPTTGIIYDAQAIKNLVGMSAPGLRGQSGGWLKFLKGINTDLNSYDQIMNELFSIYATNYSSTPIQQSGTTSCNASQKGANWMKALTASGTTLSMLAFVSGGWASIGIGIVSLLAGGSSLLDSYNNKCLI